MSFQLYPTTTFLVVLFNFLSWYFKGDLLFNWWHMSWIVPTEILVNFIQQIFHIHTMKKLK